MSQNDLVISNQTFPATRADINSALQALGSNNSGSSAPATTYANMLWYDTSSNILKMRAEANDAWINIGYFNQSADAFCILDNTQVVNTSGTQTGLLGDQSTATWQAGTGTTDSLVSPADIKAAILALGISASVGVGQTWQDLSGSRSASTSYRNTTGSPIQVSIFGASSDQSIQASSNGSSWVDVGKIGSQGAYNNGSCFVVPNNHYYRLNGGSFSIWSELR
jgi:hypothetical protein